jgi:hypothetical protein
MSLEKEFSKYSNLYLQNKLGIPIEEDETSTTKFSVNLSSQDHFYLNVRLVLPEHLLLEIQDLSMVHQVSFANILASYLRHGEDLELVELLSDDLTSIENPDAVDSYDTVFLLDETSNIDNMIKESRGL